MSRGQIEGAGIVPCRAWHEVDKALQAIDL
jgi:hypothetical protein